jgi:hypothetical protein
MGAGHGHVAVILDPKTLTVVESNFRKDGKVQYGRRVPKEKIYGVIRGKFNFPFTIPKPITIRLCLLVNQKPWKSLSVKMKALEDWFMQASAGRIRVEVSPLFTNFQNWWYRSYGTGIGNQWYGVIAEDYFDEYIMPLRYNNPHLTLAVIYNHQWQGSVFNAPELSEYGWYYPASDKGLVVCNENDISFWNYGVSAFVDYTKHEMMHWLYSICNDGNLDLTHEHWNNRQLEKCFDDFNYEKLAGNT